MGINERTKMKHLAAYCLLVLSGNATPSAKDVKKLLTDSGVECDTGDLDILISKLEGKSIPELIAAGSKEMASMPAGGAAPAGGEAAAKEEEKPKEEEPEEDV